MTREETMAETMERAYRAGVIGRAKMFKFKIMLIAHNAYKFQGRAQLYRNYLPQHIAIADGKSTWEQMEELTDENYPSR